MQRSREVFWADLVSGRPEAGDLWAPTSDDGALHHGVEAPPHVWVQAISVHIIVLIATIPFGWGCCLHIGVRSST